MRFESVLSGLNQSDLGKTDQFRLLSLSNSQEAIDFLRRQFRNPDEWCDLSELQNRMGYNPNLQTGIVGLIEKQQDNVVGAVIVYRNPFSHDEYTLPIIAVDKGNNADLPNLRNSGRGTLLVNGISEIVKELGGKAIVADTNKLVSRGGSQHFLESCGFNLIGEIPRYFDGRPEETGLMFIKHL